MIGESCRFWNAPATSLYVATWKLNRLLFAAIVVHVRPSSLCDFISVQIPLAMQNTKTWRALFYLSSLRGMREKFLLSDCVSRNSSFGDKSHKVFARRLKKKDIWSNLCWCSVRYGLEKIRIISSDLEVYLESLKYLKNFLFVFNLTFIARTFCSHRTSHKFQD